MGHFCLPPSSVKKTSYAALNSIDFPTSISSMMTTMETK